MTDQPEKQLASSERRASATAADFSDRSREWRRLFSETWGTFLLVLVAAGAAVAAAKSGVPVSPAMTVAPGIMVMAIVYFMGTVSGAHLNPAVTLAFALRGNFPWHRAWGYLAAQFSGAVLAILFLRGLFGDVGELGATVPLHGTTAIQAMLVEAVLTAGLVNTILGTASGARNVGTNGALAIGGYIALAALWAGPLTGASMNPARSLAPDLVRGDFASTWAYFVGPLAGSAIGVLFEWFLKGPPTRSGSIAAQGLMDDQPPDGGRPQD